MRWVVILLACACACASVCACGWAAVAGEARGDDARSGEASVGDVRVGDALANVRIAIERQVGYVIGDLVSYDAVITLDPNWVLRRSSLPGAGKPEYWLDLRSVGVDESHSAGLHTYTVHLVYQIFYAPIEARKRLLPAFVLTFDRPGGTTNIKVPAVSVTLSPLREVATGTGDPEANVALQPDRNAPRLSLLIPLLSLVTSAALALGILVVIAWQRSWGPFARRAGAPFGQASRTLKSVELSNPQLYPSGLLTLHRAFDNAAGWHVFADDVPRFLNEHPRFAEADELIRQFFEASRQYFFGSDTTLAATELPAAEMRGLAKRLADLERRG